jgi:UDP-2,4-diacetamido-2,4,6-trideoxy-beta-L-altropyranose hydrolase
MPNIRKANESDIRDIFNWHNDEYARRMSHTTDLVEWNRHSAWFAASLANTKRLLLICKDENTDEKVATVRFDVEDERALISINISPKMRGKRKARGCLRDSIYFFQRYFSDVRFIDAEIKPINITSQRAFLSVGFVLKKEDADVLYFEYAV